jgi:hypothetical protein
LDEASVIIPELEMARRRVEENEQSGKAHGFAV